MGDAKAAQALSPVPRRNFVKDMMSIKTFAEIDLQAAWIRPERRLSFEERDIKGA